MSMAWDILADLQYNTSLNVRDRGSNVCYWNFERSKRDKDDWLHQLGFSLIVCERITNVGYRFSLNVPRITEMFRGNIQNF